ncbi:Glyoxylate reductase-like protein [Dipodascopsis tothii]|uniref:Glyoxylate reductase-like protein n=1 Tax=Dipodascopsis tothii TaxID=44089 RepID=UPI0034CF1A21
MTVKPKVLIIQDVDEKSEAFLDFSKRFECIRYRPTTEEQFIADMKVAPYNDIAAVWAMWTGFIEFGPVRAEVIKALPPTVRVFGISSVGYDRYDVEQFSRQGIVLCNSPGMGSHAVAELALFLVLSTFRFTSAFEHMLRQERNTIRCRNLMNSSGWDNATGLPVTNPNPGLFFFGESVGGRPVQTAYSRRCGVVGAGSIGKEIMKRVAACGMSVHYYTRTPLKPDVLATLPSDMVAHGSLEELLPNCDVIVLSVPLSAATKHMLNARTMALMPAGSRIVNVGRGPLIEENALLDALDSGHISSAGLDVFEMEPVIQERLAKRWDVTLLPHVGSSAVDTIGAAEINIMANIEDVLAGGKGRTPVNAV